MDLNELFPQNKPYKVTQTRLWVLCVFETPEWVREKHPAIDLAGINGNYLLGFHRLPQQGEFFPYLGHIWKAELEPIQFPARYKTKQAKKVPILFTEYIEPYDSEIQILNRLRELSRGS